MSHLKFYFGFVQLGLTYVDLYLIHHPRYATPDIPTAWKEFEKIKADGLARSVQSSNRGPHSIVIPIVVGASVSLISMNRTSEFSLRRLRSSPQLIR